MYLFPGVLNLGSYLLFFLCASLACGGGLWWPDGSCEGPVRSWQGARGLPPPAFFSVLLCGRADRHLTDRMGKGAYCEVPQLLPIPLMDSGNLLKQLKLSIPMNRLSLFSSF